MFQAIAPPLQAFYHSLFELAMEDASRFATGPVRHTYECSSASEHRRYQMSVYPLPPRRGVLVVNALVVSGPHDLEARPPHPPSGDYIDARGFARQCAHCRRISNPAQPGRWDWVPAWVERAPPHTSHTICEPCLLFYYGPPLP